MIWELFSRWGVCILGFTASGAVLFQSLGRSHHTLFHCVVLTFWCWATCWLQLYFLEWKHKFWCQPSSHFLLPVFYRTSSILLHKELYLTVLLDWALLYMEKFVWRCWIRNKGRDQSPQVFTVAFCLSRLEAVSSWCILEHSIWPLDQPTGSYSSEPGKKGPKHLTALNGILPLTQPALASKCT